jgi:pimeloyl-ACP methyl ester carboxylesterase
MVNQKIALRSAKAVILSLLALALFPALAVRVEPRPRFPGGPQSPIPSSFARFEQMRVHYRSYGKGRDALVFVHGWTCDLTFWDRQAAFFQDRHRVILIDLPGHGESDKPHVDYTMDLFARAVDAVLKDAGVERAVLVGHSMGTPVIRQYYRLYPRKVLGLVIVDGALRPFGNKEMVSKMLESLKGPKYSEAAGGMVTYMVQPVLDPAARERIKAVMLSAPQHVSASAMEGMMAEEIWKDDKVTVPALAVLSQSSGWPPDNEVFYHGIIPNLDYQLWSGVSHFLMIDKPDEFNAAVAAFLKKQSLLGSS